MTPWDYALRYLPIQVPGTTKATPVNIGRYLLSPPAHTTPEQQRLLGKVIDLFGSKKNDRGYRLKLTVNGLPVEIADRSKISHALQVPFLGKGSPEDCQIVLQLAVMLGGVSVDKLQAWADANLGLDCNGFVGNYLFHEVQQNAWQVSPSEAEVGPSTTIDEYFWRWAGKPIEDLSEISPNRMHLIVRVDGSGKVIPQWAGTTPGHIAITQPGEILNQGAVTDSVGEQDLASAKKLGMYQKLALRTVESAGPVDGVGENWIFFIKSSKLKGVFEANRDKIHFADKVKIAPLLDSPKK
jgi:hypothetical protein